MQKINIKEIIESKAPDFFAKNSSFKNKILLKILNKFLKVDEINNFLEIYNEREGIEFINGVFEFLNVKYVISKEDISKIPSEGKLIIVSNHPLGGLDGLALISTIYSVRKDVKIVANDVLLQITNIQNFILPVDLYSLRMQRIQLQNIENALNNDEAIIFFPSGKVSRLYPNGISDGKWHNGAIKFSSKLEVPILPVYIDARNSILFYLMSLIHTKIGMFMLPQELFRKKNSEFKIKIGELIPGNTLKNSSLKPKILAKLLKQHTYKIGKDKPGIFLTEKTIIHPVPQELLEKELKKNKLLGITYDNKEIYLVEYDKGENILKEISRLRELTFRKVGEGTGKNCDMDIYDLYYKHIVLWDSSERAIVGSYRLGETKQILEKYGIRGLYNSSQFYLKENFIPILNQSIEVGRSFIQPKYWRSNALDFIWQGIGAYLSEYREIKYLWGAVSISDSYSELAKGLIISYYRKWYNSDKKFVEPIEEYQISKKIQLEVNSYLNGSSHKEDLKNLKNALKNIGFSIPVLYRKYTDITHYGGSKFLSFCVDVHFNNSIDGLILVDLNHLKEEYKERYYNTRSFVNK